jgi:site-specific DNA-methyltransferase (adenine-specific)
VDLVYLDPPFKSNQNYNVLFKEQDGAKAASQIRAFEDTWSWDAEDEKVYAEILQTIGGKVGDAMEAFRKFIGPCDMLSYLVMMCPRLVELRRVMKPTASIYLHCDPAASHYLKMLMDAIFGPGQFMNEIVWKRTPFAGSSKARALQFPREHDILLFTRSAMTTRSST